ncbi:MAG TPA: DUF5689 domain-containing protein [Cyclobacteriaceae bacterium]
MKILVYTGLRLFLIIMLAIQFISCSENGDSDPPDMEEDEDEEIINEEPEEPENISIRAFFSTYDVGKAIDDKITITTFITANDESGNIKDKIYLRDNTGAIGIRVDQDNIYQTYEVGDQLVVSLESLTYEEETRLIETTAGNAISWTDFQGITEKTVNTSDVIPQFISNDDGLSEDLVASLVTVGDYQFAEEVVLTPFLEGSTNTVRITKNSDGDQIGIFINSQSNFSDELIPTKRGNITGIVSKVEGELVIQPRRLQDMIFAVDRRAPFIKQTFDFGENTLPYQIMFPINYDPDASYPLVVFLHGAGERGSDNERQMVYGPDTFGSYDARVDYPAIVIFPQCPSDVMWSRRDKYRDDNNDWIFEFPVEDEPNYAMEMVIELMKDLMANEAVDENRIYVSGLSMGGIGVFELFYYEPDLAAAGAPIAGGHDSTFAATYANNAAFWIFHGSEDTVVPPRYSREMFTRMQELGADVMYSEAEGRGHEWNYVLNEPEMIEWMFRQEKDQ